MNGLISRTDSLRTEELCALLKTLSVRYVHCEPRVRTQLPEYKRVSVRTKVCPSVCWLSMQVLI